MEPSDVFASLLQDPETMRKLASIASELMGGMSGTPASAHTGDADAPDESTQPPAAPGDPPPALPALGEGDSTADLMRRAMPMLSAIAQSGRSAARPERLQLLTALRPFLSTRTCAQIDHAEHILSMARMTRTAVEQFPQIYGRREV